MQFEASFLRSRWRRCMHGFCWLAKDGVWYVGSLHFMVHSFRGHTAPLFSSFLSVLSTNIFVVFHFFMPSHQCQFLRKLISSQSHYVHPSIMHISEYLDGVCLTIKFNPPAIYLNISIRGMTWYGRIWRPHFQILNGAETCIFFLFCCDIWKQ